jgi:hypothetical protein
MIIISYDKISLGGLGDRIIGLISCKLIAKLLNKKFYIYWVKENIKEYIDYSKYDYELIEKENFTITHHQYIDNQQGLKDYLMNETELFPDHINIFNLNQEISQYLYKNKLFEDRDYFTDIIEEYRSLYKDILKPSETLINKIQNFIDNKTNIIGIQIRTGDKHMITNKNETYCVFNNMIHELTDILQNIKTRCDSIYKNYNIFLTSDYSGIYSIADKVWNSENIIYNHDIVQHIDRDPVYPDISKVFIDSYILSQHTTYLYISEWSNFGRIAALSSNHDNIHDLYCNVLDKKNLLSKHKNII